MLNRLIVIFVINIIVLPLQILSCPIQLDKNGHVKRDKVISDIDYLKE